jgi:hypothetical protein
MNYPQMYNTGEAELCALLTVAQSITPILYRVQAYEVVFSAQSTEPSALEMLRSASLDVYSTCFELIAHTSKELRSKWRRTRHAVLEPGKAIDMLGKWSMVMLLIFKSSELIQDASAVRGSE